jgi:hypothetical protein
MKRQTARDRINKLIEWCQEIGLEHQIETEVSLAPDLSYCVAKATVSYDGIKSTAHKMMYRKPDAQGVPDATFVAAAETIAIGRAIGFLFQEEETATEEEYQELVLMTCKRIFELYQISYSGARQYVNDISNEDLRIKAQTYLESLMTKEALNKAL